MSEIGGRYVRIHLWFVSMYESSAVKGEKLFASKYNTKSEGALEQANGLQVNKGPRINIQLSLVGTRDLQQKLEKVNR